MNTAIIVAAGKSTRMGSNTDKAFLSLGAKPVLAWSLLAFEQCTDIDQIVLVVRKDQVLAAKSVAQMFGISKIRTIVAGGSRRQDSVQNGMREMDPDTRMVVVHDGARPCVTPQLISDTIKCAKRNGCGVAAARIWDTIKYVERGSTVDHTVDRAKLWAVQTPQAFTTALLQRAYQAVEEQKVTVTDEASAVELLGEPVRLVEWRYPNIKITTAEDLPLAAAAMKIM
ncbi:MAG TPA: 2-C-methyl-D-erythritol 4-phosphate cytidylyltransferase [Kiritimatiellia bacterium]|jgi:2-C-methyl-D-erythritol 4-phosphate cytidylyltransferase|nr:2-C-methyl-D-erythritol 4-phosphate cytidylyltransferase [Kiritimatiellia bacterium]HPK37858.1 2-C-methyl-D-erythritol 4-phosphate cytidylyltransferase [Kiritimatiellia bacterium]HRU18804.1 2-C-methyl-D-erythritol 4-phosphate cytidylyltransferase [Kiritimatiellia bacterium]